MGAFLVSHLWKRSGVLTDNEIIELRYGGRPAAGLRLFRAIYFGVLRNAIVMGWVNLAMLKVLSLVMGLDERQSVWLLFGLFLVTIAYTLLAGLIGVVLTDFLQFGLALAGAILLAVMAIDDQGGLGALLEALGDRRDLLAVVPPVDDREAFLAFVAFVAIKSWSSGNTEGNGYIAQRILATRTERDARLASLWFGIAHFAIRPWPWIAVGLVAVVQYPALADPEEGYVRVMLDTLPPGLLGLLLAALLAAYMSTIDTQLNWGASYLTHDVYARFLVPNADEARLVRVARGSVVFLAAIGALATLGMDSVADAWKLLATITAGTGLILLLRWLWWRINAWSEIAVMTSSLLFANLVDAFTDITFPFSLVVVVSLSLPVAFAVTFATAPENEAVLARFYERVRPAGAWDPVAAKLGLPAKPLGWGPWIDVLAGTTGIYAAIIAAGALLLGEPTRAGITILAAALLLAFAVRRAEASPN